MPATERRTMIRPGDRLENPVTGEVLIFHGTAEQTGGESVLVETIVRPDGFVAAAHVHPHQTERFEVLEGTLGLRVGARPACGPATSSTVEPGYAAPVLERRRRRGALPLRDPPGARVRVADRDDVHARGRGQDQPEGPAQPAAARSHRRRHFDTVRLPFPPAPLPAGGARGRCAARAGPRLPVQCRPAGVRRRA